MDCGPTSRIVARYYGKNFSLQKFRDISGLNREGVSMLGRSEAAEKVGFRMERAKITIKRKAQQDWH
ncbi:cysteine peptidase family C39 domain-containing protein [Pedobacter sp. AW1-32]|uniref:cysteine peptidase family C39 domain-containing protein n=1 Tax=Pedobacter sp. AW1-32 TaxID=3383026 RepID=UPI003FF12021